MNVALVIAIAAPILDGAYGVSRQKFWRQRLLTYNTEVWANELIDRIVERACLIESQWSFLGWWTIGILGTAVQASSQVAVLVTLAVTLLLLLPMWVNVIFSPFDEARDRKHRLLTFCRLIGYSSSIVLAAVFGVGSSSGSG